METLQVDILNPKAAKLLKDLEELKLISIRSSANDGFLSLINKFRLKQKINLPQWPKLPKKLKL